MVTTPATAIFLLFCGSQCILLVCFPTNVNTTAHPNDDVLFSKPSHVIKSKSHSQGQRYLKMQRKPGAGKSRPFQKWLYDVIRWLWLTPLSSEIHSFCVSEMTAGCGSKVVWKTGEVLIAAKIDPNWISNELINGFSYSFVSFLQFISLKVMATGILNCISSRKDAKNEDKDCLSWANYWKDVESMKIAYDLWKRPGLHAHWSANGGGRTLLRHVILFGLECVEVTKILVVTSNSNFCIKGPWTGLVHHWFSGLKSWTNQTE